MGAKIITIINSKLKNSHTMIDVKFPIKVKDLAKVVDQANVNPHTMNDNKKQNKPLKLSGEMIEIPIETNLDPDIKGCLDGSLLDKVLKKYGH